MCGILLATVLFVHELGTFYQLHRETKVGGPVQCACVPSKGSEALVTCQRISCPPAGNGSPTCPVAGTCPQCRHTISPPPAHRRAPTLHVAYMPTRCSAHQMPCSPPHSTATQMSVDLARRHSLRISLDLVFPSVPCAGRWAAAKGKTARVGGMTGCRWTPGVTGHLGRVGLHLAPSGTGTGTRTRHGRHRGFATSCPW